MSPKCRLVLSSLQMCPLLFQEEPKAWCWIERKQCEDFLEATSEQGNICQNRPFGNHLLHRKQQTIAGTCKNRAPVAGACLLRFATVSIALLGAGRPSKYKETSKLLAAWSLLGRRAAACVLQTRTAKGWIEWMSVGQTFPLRASEFMPHESTQSEHLLASIPPLRVGVRKGGGVSKSSSHGFLQILEYVVFWRGLFRNFILWFPWCVKHEPPPA